MQRLGFCNDTALTALAEQRHRNDSLALTMARTHGHHLFFSILLESDFSQDAVCLSECRKERDEREHYCYSEFGKFEKQIIHLL